MNWHMMKLRPHLVHTYKQAAVADPSFGKPEAMTMLKIDLMHVDLALRVLDEALSLQGAPDYIGSEKLTYLDIMVYNELNQLDHLLGEDLEMRRYDQDKNF